MVPPWFVVLLLASCLSLRCSAAEGRRSRAALQRGNIYTTRDNKQLLRGRRLYQGPLNPSALQTYLLGVDGSDQAQVKTTLTSLEGKLLSPVPGQQGENNHWLVLARQECIEHVLKQHPKATVALYPDEYKLSRGVYKVLKLLSSLSEAKRRDGELMADLLHQDFSHLALSQKTGCPPSLTLNARTPAAVSKEQNQIVQELTAHLQKHTRDLPVHCALRAVVVPRSIHFIVPMHLIEATAGFLSRQAHVTWVNMRERTQLNNIYANAYTQASALMTSTPPSADVLAGTNGPFFPFWKAGLDGTDQVVGLVDTGLDLDSCYFWDPAFLDYQERKVARNDGLEVFYNTSHRKVVMYVFYSNGIDNEGHGTHTGSTLVGSQYGTDPTGQPDLATGIAPRARLAFYDIHAPNLFNLTNDALDLPPSIPDTYDVLQTANARVISNSWNGKKQTYGEFCEQADYYTWGNQNVLLVFAAGNAGLDQASFNSTGALTCPGLAKNTLAVGASENWSDMGIEEIRTTLVRNGSRINVSPESFVGPWSSGLVTFNIGANRTLAISGRKTQLSLMQGADSRWTALAGKTFKLVKPDPVDACEPLKQNFTRSGENVIVLIQQYSTSGPTWNKRCRSFVSALYAQASGAAGALVYDLLKETLIFMTSTRYFTFPVAGVTQAVGKELLGALDRNQTVTLTWAPDPDTQLPPPENLAWFSSYGAPFQGVDKPNGNTRVKPDLVAPGYLTSAYSDQVFTGKMDNCDVVGMLGTSMSTPVVAGAAVLARQYFVDGFYPAGAPSKFTRFDPSGPLLKAVLLSGTVAMKGVARATAQPLAPPPSQLQGFGRLDLASSLPLAGDQRGWKLQVVDRALIESTGHSHRFTVVVGNSSGNSRPLTITLVWFDQPATPGSTHQLVNDLDLVVTAPSTRTAGKTRTLYGNNVRGGDAVNTVEKVHIPQAPSGTYEIRVRAKSIFIDASPQPFSLVVLGAVDNTIDSPFNPAFKVRNFGDKAPETQKSSR